MGCNPAAVSSQAEAWIRAGTPGLLADHILKIARDGDVPVLRRLRRSSQADAVQGLHTEVK